MPYLISDGDDNVGQKFDLSEGETILGRHPESGVVIDDAAVSRNHARVLGKNGKYLLEDLKSRNGTFLNRRLIQHATRLLNGDRIRVCDHGFTFYLDEPNSESGSRNTQEADKRNLESSILLDDQLGSDLSSIMSQVDMESHHSGSVAVSATPEAKLMALMNITKTLGTAIALDKVLPRVLDCLFDLFRQADRGFVVMELADGQLKPLAMKLRKEDDKATFRISRTIVRHVLDSRNAVISTDAANDDRFDLSQSIADFRIRSMMCAPLLGADGKSVGIIQLDTIKNAVGFATEDLDILATVAIQASAAVDRAKMHEVELRQHQISRDLELANEVQNRLLPSEPPEIEGYGLFDYYRPAEQVGGDYFDYIELPDGRTAILIGDVVGHGIAAALMMAKVSAEARFALATHTDASAAMGQLNRAICKLRLERFITIALVVLNSKSNKLQVVNAGHLPPIIGRSSGLAESLSTEFSGLPIGIADDVEYRQFPLELMPGDILTMYTDGISEASNVAGELFGNRRVIDLANKRAWAEGGEFGNALVQLVRQHMAGTTQQDDICLVCISRHNA